MIDANLIDLALEAAVAAGMAAAGCRVELAGILSTPGVGVAVKALGADGGIVLTASHNPTPWNGVKAITELGGAPTAIPGPEVFLALKQGVALSMRNVEVAASRWILDPVQDGALLSAPARRAGINVCDTQSSGHTGT